MGRNALLKERKMKMGKWAWFLLATAPFLAGCSGFWDAPATSTTTTTTLSGGYFFLLDTGTSSIISYDINAGVLTSVGTPVTLPATPIAMTVAPNGDFLFVSTTNGIYVYTIASGVLTLGNSSTYLSQDEATAMAVDTSDSWLLESSGSVLYAIPIVSTTGAFDSTSTPARTTQQFALPGSTVNQLAFSTNNAFLFAALGTNGSEEFSFTSSSSSAPLGSSTILIKLKGIASLSVAVDPSDRMVYVGESAAASGSNSGGLRAFALTASTGALSEISGSPISSGGTGPYFILPKSTLDYVYVANWTGESSAGNITGFEITATNSATSPYALTKINSVATGIRPTALAEDSDKNFVLAANAGGSPYLDAFIFDTTTAGQLDNVLTSSAFVTGFVTSVP
jgi:6-phosphogluconolactonase (cycloisomerase 2 family)